MALKFLNKKGWHTGSLRNIENVWKAEQKHDAEQKKLEELRKQIQEERERAEFRQLQEQAGLVPRQERLEFLYDSGLAVGKGSSSFTALEALPKTDTETGGASSAANQQQSSVPGALFEEKPQSANDAWRKLHSDPLLLIRQREQDALARVKNNPVQMAMIRKSVEATKRKDKTSDKKDKKASRKNDEGDKKHRHEKSKHRKHSSTDRQSERREIQVREQRPSSPLDPRIHEHHSQRKGKRYNDDSEREEYKGKEEKYRRVSRDDGEHEEYRGKNERGHSEVSRKDYESSNSYRHETNSKRRKAVKLSEEERAARLREMQMDAELHEQQRWKRLKKADEKEAQEDANAHVAKGKNFLDAAHRSIYGAEKGGSSTIEESVRRRTYYSQGRSDAEGNAFRR